MSACWLAVASAEHVAIGRRDGFMPVGRGKRAPLVAGADMDLIAQAMHAS